MDQEMRDFGLDKARRWISFRTKMSHELKKEVVTYTLGRSAFGRGLNPEDLSHIAEVCSLRSVNKNEYLFRQGEPAEGFYLIQSGSIKVHRILQDGREQVINIFGPLESFAEIVLSGVANYPVSAAAVENGQVIFISRSKLGDLLKRVPDLSLRLIASMSMHLKYLVERLEQQKYQQADRRLSAWILQQLNPGSSNRFRLSMKKKVLAAQLDVTSETLSRTLNLFKKNGWLEEQGNDWVILNRFALEKCQEGGEG